MPNTNCDKLGLIVMTFHHSYPVHHYPPDPGNSGFAFVRWTLNAIAILLVGATMLMGAVIFSVMIQHWG